MYQYIYKIPVHTLAGLRFHTKKRTRGCGALPQHLRPAGFVFTRCGSVSHGYSMYSVRKVLDHYDGHISFRTENGCFRMTIGFVGFSESVPSATIKNRQHFFER